MKDRTSTPTSINLASHAPIPMPGRLASDWYTTAARAEHNRHCVDCREMTAAMDAAAAERGESMRRSARRLLGYRTLTVRRAVNG